MNAPENSELFPENSEDNSEISDQEVYEFIRHLVKKLCKLLKKHHALHVSDISSFLTKPERRKYRQVLEIMLEEGAIVYSGKHVDWVTGEGKYLELAPHIKTKLESNPDLLICFCNECTEKRWNMFQSNLRRLL